MTQDMPDETTAGSPSAGTVAGTVNGLILPIGFGVLLWVAWRRHTLLLLGDL
jgi:hypothetical protein